MITYSTLAVLIWAAFCLGVSVGAKWRQQQKDIELKARKQEKNDMT